MRILLITPVYPHAGNPTEGLFNEQHTQALVQSGMKVTVMVCKPWLPRMLAKVWGRYRVLADLPRLEKRGNLSILYARYLHIPQYRWPNLTIASCTRSILRVLKRFASHERFDVVQVHSAWPVGLAAPAVAKRLKCPFVLTLHIQDDARLYAKGKGALLYQQMLEKASAVVAVGSPLARFVRPLMNSNGERLKIIPNGAVLNKVKPAHKQTSPNQETVGQIISVGNLWPIKGIDFNLRALADLERKRVPWKRYVIVGDGPERALLEKLAQELGIANKIHFTGRLPHHEVFPELAKADIFSLPSWQEAFGVAYLEAMSCGKPVIGCWGQGAEDIIRHEKDGLLVQPQDVDSLAKALQRLIEEPVFAAQLGQAGISRARQFTWERNVAEYLAIYRDVCASS
jgi:glycosyltransferase involved in cell wall biosynthesis